MSLRKKKRNRYQRKKEWGATCSTSFLKEDREDKKKKGGEEECKAGDSAAQAKGRSQGDSYCKGERVREDLNGGG